MTLENSGSATRLTHCGRNPKQHHGAVSTPVYRASTILFDDLASLDAKEGARLRYGRRGTPTTHSLEDAVCALEYSDKALVTPSGVSAIANILMCFAEPGAHFLVSDSSYGPTRKFCEHMLRRLGVDTTYYDPTIGSGIEELIRPETALIWMESPGSQTFEVQDVDAIVAVAKSHGVKTAIDNTWSGGFFLQPMKQGVDISMQAGTKYISGHSDLMLGTIACTEELYTPLRETYLRLGLCLGADDAFLALRGLRTMPVRMHQHHVNGLEVADWLAEQPEVIRVMHPGRPQDPHHAQWKRQFSGASGLFGFVLEETDRTKLARLFDHLELFGMGSSWGGFESLLVPSNPSVYRSATEWNPTGQTVRIHVGLEDPADLIRDLRDGFDRLSQGG